MKCKFCGALTTTDTIKSLTYCTDCGAVQSDSQMVSALQFGENKGIATLSGKIIQMAESFTRVGNKFLQTTSFYVENKIESICNGLGLSHEHAMTSYRIYRLSCQYNLSKGKNIHYTLCACIYAVCRQQSTPHLLIDFSVLLRIDVNKIGRIFLKILNFLGLKIDVVDPSILIPRFATRLNIKNSRIVELSIRLVARMKRDWIVVGRRPNNLCGAAILAASRVYNESRSITEVARTVHASTATIARRLEELRSTDSANLCVDDFLRVWLEGEKDPPIIKKDLVFACEDEDIEQNSKSREEIGENEEKIIENKETESNLKYGEDGKNKNLNAFINTKIVIEGNEENFNAERINETVDENKKFSAKIDEILEDEIEMKLIESSDNDMILTEEEFKDKEKLWNEMYGDFMAWKAAKLPVDKKIRRRKKKNYENTAEAVINTLKQRKLTKKIDFEAIRRLFID